MEALFSLTLGPPLGSCSSSIFWVVHDPSSLSSSFGIKGGAFRNIPCFSCGALFFWCGIVRHQNHCQAYKVLLLYGFKNSFISSLAPSPPNSMRLDFGITSFKHLPFGSSSIMFICVHPFHSLVGHVVYFLPSFWLPNTWHVWCGGLTILVILSVVSFSSTSRGIGRT